MIGPDSVLAARDGMASVEIDGEIVLYDDAERCFHRLNPSAATLWRCLDGHATLAEIARDIAHVYAEEPGTVLTDLVGTARRLSAEGLLAD